MSMGTDYIAVNGIRFEIRRNARRKNIAVGVDDGVYFAAAPQRVSRKELESLLLRNFDETIEALKEKLAAQRGGGHKYRAGELFYCRGELYPLEISDGPLRFDGSAFISAPFGDADAARSAFEFFYARKTRSIVQEEFPAWCKRIGAGPKRVNIKNVRTLWGSCSASGSITFSLRLALVAPPLMEYVMIHELCHFFEMNHSKDFWLRVARWCPDYAERRAELRRSGYTW
ncbi:M48 family metallopeptidase [Synergistes jonesii]|uniref:M48 family metallopeptidase n=1 Tax=Synergistes jonesii TaxID=2754 RepID=UPI00242AB707|nr:SprT family zinc-dependent metalloprotease [Synergistes jonesii]